jgi:hypothetical protein
VPETEEGLKLEHTAKNKITKQILSECGKFHLACKETLVYLSENKDEPFNAY